MSTIDAKFSTLPGTAAAVGVTGRHTVVVDRPEGRAGGRGLGLNGGQLLALAIGGCLCNDVRYVADEQAIAIGGVSVDVSLTLDDTYVTGATARVMVDVPAGVDAAMLVERAAASSTVVLSLTRGIPIAVTPI
jgi:organic hydroperoxide reductase OsmC/OhrA